MAPLGHRKFEYIWSSMRLPAISHLTFASRSRECQELECQDHGTHEPRSSSFSFRSIRVLTLSKSFRTTVNCIVIQTGVSEIQFDLVFVRLFVMRVLWKFYRSASKLSGLQLFNEHYVR